MRFYMRINIYQLKKEDIITLLNSLRNILVNAYMLVVTVSGFKMIYGSQSVFYVFEKNIHCTKELGKYKKCFFGFSSF